MDCTDLYLKINHNLQENIQASLEKICNQFEQSWREKEVDIDISLLPTIDDLLQAIEDVCETSFIERIIVNIDEAAHVFIPAQQRQFFTLFRDMRSPYLKCNAAIYPGTTCFGDSFQPMHDAMFLHISRNIQDDDSVSINTIGELAASNESAVMKAYYVGEVRAKQMKNAAYAALFEYLLG